VSRRSDDGDLVALVTQAREGDARAFGELYRRFGRFVHGVVVSRLPPDEAEDVTQEVFTQAWTRLEALREPAAFGAWIAAIARRRSADHLRRRRVHEGLDETPPVGESQTAALGAREILGAIRALPEAYRETLTLRLVEGHSGPEIAALTGLTPASVRVNLYRGFKLLRERLGARS
jgi:RNA polymerase sigma-70 factor (ECF subfamily)